MSNTLDPKHFAGKGAPEALKRFNEEKTFASLVDAITYAIENDIPAKRFSLIDGQINELLKARGDLQVDENETGEAQKLKSSESDPDEKYLAAIRFFQLIASLHPTACVDYEPTEEPKRESESEGAQKLASLVSDMVAHSEKIDAFLEQRKALKWYPNSYYFLKAFGEVDGVVAIAEAIDDLLPQFLQEPQPKKNNVRWINQEKLLAWKPLLNKVATASIFGESNRKIVEWTLESVFGERNLVDDFEDDGFEGAVRLVVLLLSAPDIVEPFIQRLGILGDEQNSDGGGISVNLLGITLLLGRVNLEPIDRVWDDGRVSALVEVYQKISETDLGKYVGIVQPTIDLSDQKPSQPGAKFTKLKINKPSMLTVDSLVDLFRLPAYDGMFFGLFLEALKVNYHEITRDQGGEFRMPWSRMAAERLGYTLFDYHFDEEEADRHFAISPAFPLMFISRGAGGEYLPEYYGFEIADDYGDRIEKHPQVISKLVHFLINESWPKLASAVLAYHLIMHAIEKRPLWGFVTWRGAMRACEGEPGSEFVQTAMQVLNVAGADQRTKEWAGQFLKQPDAATDEQRGNQRVKQDARSLLSDRIDMGTRAFVEKQLIHAIGDEEAFFALHERTRNWLLDFELRWRKAQPDFGSGEFSGWGSLGVDMWKPFESELQQRLAIIWEGESGDKAREFLKRTKGYTVRQKPDIDHYLLLILHSSPPAAVQQAFIESGVDIAGLRAICRSLRDMKNLRNKGAHPSRVMEEELVSYRSKLLRDGVLKEFVFAITAGDRKPD